MNVNQRKIRRIYLASQSPRRKTLLSQIAENLNINIKILKSDTKKNMESLEEPKKNETPLIYTQRVAMRKAIKAMQTLELKKKPVFPILTADTTVSFKNKILGKPRSKQDAFLNLMKLSNGCHKVITSVVLVDLNNNKKIQNKKNIQQFTQVSTVWFGEISSSWLENYVLSGEPMDKSGGYGIQGKGQEIIKKINGSYSGIMGLPLFETNEMLTNYYKQ